MYKCVFVFSPWLEIYGAVRLGGDNLTSEMGQQEEWHTVSDSFLLLQKIGEALRQSPTHTVVVRYDPGLCAEISGVHFWTCSYT